MTLVTTGNTDSPANDSRIRSSLRETRREGIQSRENEFVDITSENDDLPWIRYAVRLRRSTSPAGQLRKSEAVT